MKNTLKNLQNLHLWHYKLINSFWQSYITPTTVSSGAARNFKKGGRHNFHIFFKRIFFGRTSLKLIEKQFSSREVRGHALPEKF